MRGRDLRLASGSGHSGSPPASEVGVSPLPQVGWGWPGTPPVPCWKLRGLPPSPQAQPPTPHPQPAQREQSPESQPFPQLHGVPSWEPSSLAWVTERVRQEPPMCCHGQVLWGTRCSPAVARRHPSLNPALRGSQSAGGGLAEGKTNVTNSVPGLLSRGTWCPLCR